jgi:ribosome-binding factor A
MAGCGRGARCLRPHRLTHFRIDAPGGAAAGRAPRIPHPAPRTPHLMANDNRRADRVAEAIREEVARFLTEGVKDPRIIGFVTVTGVDVTKDLRHARVYVSVMGTDGERASTLEGLASLAAHLRPRVARALRLRLAPELEFRLDQSVEHAARIETLLTQIREGQTPADEDQSD